MSDVAAELVPKITPILTFGEVTAEKLLSMMNDKVQPDPVNTVPDPVPKPPNRFPVEADA